MPRPTKTETERRSMRVNVRLTRSGHAGLAAKASAYGLTLCDMLIRGAERIPMPPPPPPVPFALINELQRIGVNLNQLTRLAHIGEDVQAELASLLAELRPVLDQAFAYATAAERGDA